MQYGECVHVEYRVLSPLIMFICNLGASPPACVSVQMHVCVFKNPASADGLLSLSLSLILSSAPALSSFPLSRARALNEAGGQRQCAANWPSLPGAPAACD